MGFLRLIILTTLLIPVSAYSGVLTLFNVTGSVDSWIYERPFGIGFETLSQNNLSDSLSETQPKLDVLTGYSALPIDGSAYAYADAQQGKIGFNVDSLFQREFLDYYSVFESDAAARMSFTFSYIGPDVLLPMDWLSVELSSTHGGQIAPETEQLEAGGYNLDYSANLSVSVWQNDWVFEDRIYNYQSSLDTNWQPGLGSDGMWTSQTEAGPSVEGAIDGDGFSATLGSPFILLTTNNILGFTYDFRGSASTDGGEAYINALNSASLSLTLPDLISVDMSPRLGDTQFDWISYIPTDDHDQGVVPVSSPGTLVQLLFGLAILLTVTRRVVLTAGRMNPIN